MIENERKWLTLTEKGDILDLKMNEKENKWLKMTGIWNTIE